jgi:hypothetical protein
MSQEVALDASRGDSEVDVEGICQGICQGICNAVGLPSVVIECRPRDADTSQVVRQRLAEAIGSKEAQTFLAKYRTASAKSAQGKCQRVFFSSEGTSLKLA